MSGHQVILKSFQQEFDANRAKLHRSKATETRIYTKMLDVCQK